MAVGRRVLVTAYGMDREPGEVVHEEPGWALVRVGEVLYSFDDSEMEPAE